MVMAGGDEPAGVPSAFIIPRCCRSILTVPWIELGGSVEIKCPQTGYYANVEFLTKPFYGGKRNKVSAEVSGWY